MKNSVYSVRIEKKLIKKVDAYRKYMAEVLHSDVSRSKAMVALMEIGIEKLEEEGL